MPDDSITDQGGSRRRIVHLASEAIPFAKTGGLAEVVGSLPAAQALAGHDVSLFVPLYHSCKQVAPLEPTGLHTDLWLSGRWYPVSLWKSSLPESSVTVYLVEQQELFERDRPGTGGSLYQYRDAQGRLHDYPDNAQRFILFCRAVLWALQELHLTAYVVHCHDWQTALVPVYLKVEDYRSHPCACAAVILTIHNLAYQGIFTAEALQVAGLPTDLFSWRYLEYYGHVNFLKGGIVFADGLTTVSPTYAREIQTPEYGCGLDGLLRSVSHKLVGIVNGVDYKRWNPATDPYLPRNYDSATVTEGKSICKRELQRELGLVQRGDVPLLGMIARLVEQKGLDLLEQAAPQLQAEDIQLVVLGVGERRFHDFLERWARGQPGRVAAVFAFDERLAHRIEAGADIYLMPSRFEPSGLNQLYSLRYGTVPVVRATGGLQDTVVDCTEQSLAAGQATGFVFGPPKAEAFLHTLRHACETYRKRPNVWRQLQTTGMSQDWSWSRSARLYLDFYEKTLAGRRYKQSASVS
ncbi:MAG: glycogen synthase GlgA [Gemmataceae bacterium]